MKGWYPYTDWNPERITPFIMGIVSWGFQDSDREDEVVFSGEQNLEFWAISPKDIVVQKELQNPENRFSR